MEADVLGTAQRKKSAKCHEILYCTVLLESYDMLRYLTNIFHKAPIHRLENYKVHMTRKFTRGLKMIVKIVLRETITVHIYFI